jgi:hypothetical protein
VETTDRFRLPVLAGIYDRLGEPALARECLHLAQSGTFTADWRVDLLAGLDARGAYWYLADQGFHAAMAAAAPRRPSPDHTWNTVQKLIKDPGFSESLLFLLAS